jgi:hypothetical protein
MKKNQTNSYPYEVYRVVKVHLGRWETRRSVVTRWQEYMIRGDGTKRNTFQFKNIQEKDVLDPKRALERGVSSWEEGLAAEMGKNKEWNRERNFCIKEKNSMGRKTQAKRLILHRLIPPIYHFK